MNTKMKFFLLAAVLSTTLAGLITGAQFASAGATNTATSVDAARAIPLKEAKLIIEHNAKDRDTGFQGFIDSEGWNKITVTDPNGNEVLQFKGESKLGELGLTELFFESVEPEPENRDVPIPDLLKTLPEGTYTSRDLPLKLGMGWERR